MECSLSIDQPTVDALVHIIPILDHLQQSDWLILVFGPLN